MTQTQADSPPITSPSVRVVSMTVYVVALVLWTHLIGLPKSAAQVFGWIWAATIAWNVRAPWRHHLAFPRDWWPPLVLLTVYLFSRGIADDLGLGTVHVTQPIAVDRWLFGGTLPTAYLQEHLCGTPCDPYSSPRWYDVVLTTVYYSHFFVAITLAAVLWVRNRTAWVGYMRRYLSLSVVALVVYVTFPMAPPWMAAREGLLPGDVHRLTGRGWWELNHSGLHEKVAALGNPVAAMPSLHAAVAWFVAWYAVSTLRTRWRWLILAYPLAMSFMLVYYAEHYVVDVLAGIVMLALVLRFWTLWERAHDEAGHLPEQELGQEPEQQPEREPG